MARWTCGVIEVVRVPDPEVTLAIPQDGPTEQRLRATGWLDPYLAADGSLLVGSSATLVRTRSSTVLVDPWLAFDDPARLAPRLAALRAVGVKPDDVDIVINTHVDGIGANVEADGTPVFPRARYLLPAAELEALCDLPVADRPTGTDAFLDLADLGRLELVEETHRVATGVRLEAALGHSPGHMVVWVGSAGHSLLIAGHLFLHPAQVASPAVTVGDVDPELLTLTREALLDRCASRRSVLVGPLFVDPGGGRVVAGAAGWELQAEH